MRILKLLLPVFAVLAMTACQRVPGERSVDITRSAFANVNPALPAGWEPVSRRNAIGFTCPIRRCQQPGAIIYAARQSPLDMEDSVRRRIISAALLQEVGKSIFRASNGQLNQTSVRDITNSKTAGFEHVFSMRQGIVTTHGVGRTIYTGGEMRYIIAIGMTPNDARRFMRIALAGMGR